MPAELSKAAAEGRAVLFVGAGISRGSKTAKGRSERGGLPGWEGLLLAILDRAARRTLPPRAVSELKKAIKDQKFLFVAHAIREQMDEEFHTTLRSIINDTSVKPNQRHRLIAEIPFVAILTTNYDKLLEKAFAQRGDEISVFTPIDAHEIITGLVDGKRFILKSHGDIEKRDTLILSEGDYRELLHRRPGYLTALQTVFLMKTVVFIGTSLTDPDVRYVLERVKEAFRGHTPMHFALVPKSRAGELERQFWKKFYGIELLRYEDHAEVDQFLQELKDKALALSPRLLFQQQIREAKWYPSNDTIKRIRSEIATTGPTVLNCGMLDDHDALEEINILFDTSQGSLYQSRVNLSIKVLASPKTGRGRISCLTARWIIIKLRGFPGDPVKMWDRNQEPEPREKTFPYSGDIRKDMKAIVKTSMPKEMNDLLYKVAGIKKSQVKPALMIFVYRRRWLFSSRNRGWKPRIFISDVGIYPYSDSWLEKLPPEFRKLRTKTPYKDWRWSEIELEDEEGDGGADNQDHIPRFAAFARRYKLDTDTSRNWPVAKYHHAIKILQTYSGNRAAAESVDWIDFLRKGD